MLSHGELEVAESCLLSDFQMDKRKDPSSVDIKKVLLEMRKFRMGLIQTADQLRFSYLAVIEGAKFIMGDSSVQVSFAFLDPRAVAFSLAFLSSDGAGDPRPQHAGQALCCQATHICPLFVCEGGSQVPEEVAILS